MTAAGSAGEAVTPGQAAYEAFKAWRAERDPMMLVADWTHPMVEAAREGWEIAAQAAIAAVEVPSLVINMATEMTESEERELREKLKAAIAAQQPQGAPWDGLTQMHLTIPDTTPPRREQPAPELAAAMRETAEVRDGYARLCEEFGDHSQSGQSARISLTVLNRHRKLAGLPGRRPAPTGERRDAFMQMREQLDAIAELAGHLDAEADEDTRLSSSHPDGTSRVILAKLADALHATAGRIRHAAGLPS